MTAKGILLGVVIGAVLTALIGLGIMRNQDSQWAAREQQLVDESARWQHMAGERQKEALEASERANSADREAAVWIAERDKTKSRLARKAPATLTACLEQNKEFRASELIADRAIAFMQVAGLEKDTVIDKQEEQIVALNQAMNAEHERGDGWKRQTKRKKVKKAFYGIGMAAGGALIGYGAAAAANR